jgi:hypothetical protein
MTETVKPPVDFSMELDDFEDRLTEFVAGASPTELVALVTEATMFIESKAENADSETFRFEGWTELNNATSACNTAARALKNRI